MKIRQQATKAGASGRGETIEDGSRAIGGPQAIAGLCFLCCAAVVGYDLYLIIAK